SVDPDDFGQIAGDAGTTVNGGESVFAKNVTSNVTIKLGDGNDMLDISETFDFPRNLVIDLGTGDDDLSLIDTRVAGKLSITSGDGDDQLSSAVATAGRKVSVKTDDW